jgi:biopolymer transport protein ExbD
MGKFSKKKEGGTPAISTASLPDIVFMLLFFFMVATVMRESGKKMVDVKMPSADQVKKIKKKGLVAFIYIGKPSKDYISKYGSEPKIQLEDAFAEPKDVGAFVMKFVDSKREEEKKAVVTSLKIDMEAGMGLIRDVKEELRKVNALKVNYSTKKGSVLNNE